MDITRRECLATIGGGALLAATGLPALANEGRDKHQADTLYGHGTVWNRDLEGDAGELNLSFDLRVNLETGTGSGTATDPVFPDWGMHFAIDSTETEKLPGGESRYTMTGVVTRAVNPDNEGLPVRILAETRGDTTAIAIALGDMAFGGAGLVVIAIIAILIGLLLPAVQS